MKLSKIFNVKAVLLILVAAIVLGLVASSLISLAERIFFPQKYKELVFKYADKYAVPRELVFAVIKTESGFDPNALSNQEAMGLMQLLQSTAEDMAKNYLNENPDTINLYDPETNIKYGTYYLQYLFSLFGSWEKAIIAYNWGLGRLRNFIDNHGYTEGDYDSIIEKEPRNYIKKVTYYWEKYKEIYK